MRKSVKEKRLQGYITFWSPGATHNGNQRRSRSKKGGRSSERPHGSTTRG